MIEYSGNPLSMEDFPQRLVVRAATIDEFLSDAFIPLADEKSDADKAALRLASWCRSSAGGDWDLFTRRLARDGLSLAAVRRRLATVRRSSTAPSPLWLSDAKWVLDALCREAGETSILYASAGAAEQPFEHLLSGVVEVAENVLRSGLDASVLALLSGSAYSMLRHTLLSQLADLCAPALYEVFSDGSQQNQVAADPQSRFSSYSMFLDHMREVGFAELFEAKPVLLRLMASITRQWIDANREFLVRLSSDLPEIRSRLCNVDDCCAATSVRGQISDPHNFGRSVLLVGFADGHRVVYKPKDLRIDSAWSDVVLWLNANGGPLDLRTARVVIRNGYGWAEHIEYAECADEAGVDKFFRRAGCWVALFHVFAGTDIHKENVIAVADHPVPIDLEMLLQAEESEKRKEAPGLAALRLATKLISNSVLMTGLLPSYGRNLRNRLVDLGGLSQPTTESLEIYWENLNQDGMRPARRPKEPSKSLNVPGRAGEHGRLGNFLESFISGFDAYAGFLCDHKEEILSQNFWDTLRQLPVRKILRPTRFYYLLLTRLKEPRNMGDGAEWSAHLDFCSRLADWDEEVDPLWPLLRAERNALAELNIPQFIMQSDGTTVFDWHGIAAQASPESGFERARTRLGQFDGSEVRRQSDFIRTVTASVSSGDSEGILQPHRRDQCAASVSPGYADSKFLDSANEVVSHISQAAIRSGASAAWIGIDWHGDSEKSRLVPLGYDLYSGTPGISLLLAAHARVTGDQQSSDLALAGLAALRCNVKSVSAARFARVMGLGGALGMGSVVYTLTVIGCILRRQELIDDAVAAATLFTDECIAADRAFDAIGGSAGAILCLLKLYHQTDNKAVLARAVKCGEHLLQTRPTNGTQELWCGNDGSTRPLTGMAHGAAGFAYAFGALHDATGNDAFLRVAQECLRFENCFFDKANTNWPDLREQPDASGSSWPCQWCHGAGGIGLARVGLLRHKAADERVLIDDIRAAVQCVKMRWPDCLDTLCCGSLGNIELLQEAGRVLKEPELNAEATHRLLDIVAAAAKAGDFRLGYRGSRFNLGLFKGIAGVGYTLLRRANSELPNVLLWE